MTTIEVHWLDGLQCTYRADRHHTADGQLHIYEYFGISGGVKDEWHIPLSNVRVWRPLQ